MKSKTEFLNKINKDRDEADKILEGIEFSVNKFDVDWEDNSLKIISTPTKEEYSAKESNDEYRIIKWMVDNGYLGQTSQNNSLLKELMELIKKHVIALHGNVLIQGGKITRVQDKKSAGLDEKAYKRMFELYEKLQN